MDPETLTALLRGEHFGMPDRIARGAWPHPPLLFSELVHHVAGVLQREGLFPALLRPRPENTVPDGGIIEKQSDLRYVYRRQRPLAINPHVLAEQGEHVFSTAEDAAHHYLIWDLNLPGDLDGWQVVR